MHTWKNKLHIVAVLFELISKQDMVFEIYSVDYFGTALIIMQYNFN